MVFDAHERAFAFFKGGLRALAVYEQHEDGGGDSLPRQGPPVQSPLFALLQMLLASSCRAGRLYAGVGMGEGPGREPGRPRPRTLLHAAAAIQELRRTQRLASRQMPFLGESRHAHPERPDQTIWEVFEEGSGRSSFRIAAVSMGSTRCRPRAVEDLHLVRFDNNKYSVSERRPAAPSTSTPTADIGSLSARMMDARWPASTRGALRPRQDDLRSLALRAGSGAQARRSAQWSAVQGLGVAGGARSGAAQARRLPHHRPV